MTLWEILKANKTGIAPDMFTMLAARKMNGGRDRLHELSGTPPLSFTAKGKPLTAWSITGNTVQNGTPTPENPVEVKAVGDRTANLLNFEDLIAAPSGLMPDGRFTFPHLLALYLKPNTTYTCASSGTGSITSTQADLSRSIYFCRTDEQSSVNMSNPVTYTTDSTGRVFIGFIDSRTNAQQYLNKTAYVWLNEGSTALPYEPYGYKIPVVTSADGTEPITTPIYLPTPLYSGEVLRSEGSRDVKWGVVDLGSLTWVNEFDLSQGQIRADNLSNPIISTMVYGGNCYCQSYMYDGIKKYTEIKNNSIAFSNSKQIPFLRIKNTSYDNVQDLINSMSGVKLYYELAKPKTETITAPQIPTLNGTTVIDVDTAVKPESMTIKYRR